MRTHLFGIKLRTSKNFLKMGLKGDVPESGEELVKSGRDFTIYEWKQRFPINDSEYIWFPIMSFHKKKWEIEKYFNGSTRDYNIPMHYYFTNKIELEKWLDEKIVHSIFVSQL